MTAHHKAMPRLRDELAGSMGSAVEANPQAVIGGLVVVNLADSFLSPLDQPDPLPAQLDRLRRNSHAQPQDATFVVDSLGKLAFRQNPSEVGFDSMGIIVVRHDNELPHPRVELVHESPCPPITSPRHYRSFIVDMGNKYRVRFGG
jgi:hypothetical protein